MRIFGFAGWSGSGKTTLVEQLVPRLVGRGLRVSLVKHAHHRFEVDQPGKDSYRHRRAGCTEVLITSAVRWALMHELRGDAELRLPDVLARLSPCDLVLVEGYKRHALPKLEIYRTELGKPLLHPRDANIVGSPRTPRPPSPGVASPCSASTRMTRLPRLSRSGRCTRPLAVDGPSATGVS